MSHHLGHSSSDLKSSHCLELYRHSTEEALLYPQSLISNCRPMSYLPPPQKKIRTRQSSVPSPLPQKNQVTSTALFHCRVLKTASKPVSETGITCYEETSYSREKIPCITATLMGQQEQRAYHGTRNIMSTLQESRSFIKLEVMIEN